MPKGLVVLSTVRLFAQNFVLAAALTLVLASKVNIATSAALAFTAFLLKEAVEILIEPGTGAVSDAAAAGLGACAVWLVYSTPAKRA